MRIKPFVQAILTLSVLVEGYLSSYKNHHRMNEKKIMSPTAAFVLSSSSNTTSNTTTTTRSPSFQESQSAYRLVNNRKSLMEIPIYALLIHICLVMVVRNNNVHCIISSTSLKMISSTSLLPIFNTVVLPLLSSACCSIQLIINLFAGGCAGFNTFLGPFRTVFMGWMLHHTCFSILIPNRNSNSHIPKYLMVILISWSVAFMPEMLDLVNHKKRQRFLKNKLSDDRGGGSRGEITRTSLMLSIPTMGCAACVNKVLNSSSLSVGQRLDGSSTHVVEAFDSWLVDGSDDDSKVGRRLKGGVVKVDIISDSNETSSNHLSEVAIKSIIHGIRSAGFQNCEVLSVTSNNT